MAQFNSANGSYQTHNKTLFEVNQIATSNGAVVSNTNRFPVTLGSENITITGNVNVSSVVAVNSSPSDPVHTHITEVGNSGILSVPYLPIGGTVTANQGTSPWVVSPSGGSLPVNFPEASTAFEELMTVQPYPIIQLDATYGLEEDKVLVRQIGGGTAGVANDIMWYASSGTTTGAGSLSSKRYIRYRPGTGTMARFTALFTTSDANNLYGVTGTNQQAGLQNLGSGYLFGFSGLTGNNSEGSDQRQFGILHRYNGKIDIHTLTIDTAPTGTQTATVTLNGVAYNVSITAGTSQQCAQQIAAGNTYSAAWVTDQIGNTVVFSATQVGVRSGSYSFSSSGTGTLATGTMVQTSAGVNNTNDWTYIDKWDNPISFNPTKLNVFAVDMRWLGAGIVRFFMEHPTTGKMTLLHTQHWANKNTLPHVNMPSFRVGYASGILAGQTPSQSATVRGASMFAGIQGGITQTTYSEGWYAVDTGNRVKDVIHHLISVKNPYTKSSKLNTREFILQDLSASVQGADPCVILVYINPIVETGQILFDTIPESTAIVSTTSTPTISSTLNNPVCSFVLGINGTAQFDLLPYRLVLSPGDFLTVAIISTNGITRTAVSLTWATD
jgi:hypothetical protein